MSTFIDLGISQKLCSKLEALGITEPTAVQEQVVPLVSQRRNLLFQSETGTGKTFAYLLPLVERLEGSENPRRNVRLLIASPTYELASQIKVQVQLVSSLPVALCIGGSPIARQIEALKAKPEIVIGGPSRLLELIHLKKLKADAVDVLVLDEADRLLSPELRDATQGLLERLPRDVQLVGNSATVSNYTRKILVKARESFGEAGDSCADKGGTSGVTGALSAKNGDSTAKDAATTDRSGILLVTLPPEDILRRRITHWAIFAERRDKIDTLRSFISAVKPRKLIVFTAKTDQIDIIVGKLRYHKVECEGLSSKTDKKLRKQAIDRFRSGKLSILVTSDLASRGLDIPGISHVVQMDLPQGTDFFVHRAGRTARAGQNGINCVIGDAWEMEQYAALEKKLGLTVYPKVLYGGRLSSPQDFEQQDEQDQ